MLGVYGDDGDELQGDIDGVVAPLRLWPGPPGSEPDEIRLGVEGLLVWAMHMQRVNDHDWSDVPNSGGSCDGVYVMGKRAALGVKVDNAGPSVRTQTSDAAHTLMAQLDLLPFKIDLARQHGAAATRPEIPPAKPRLWMQLADYDASTGEAIAVVEKVGKRHAWGTPRWCPLAWDISPDDQRQMVDDYMAWRDQLDRLQRYLLRGQNEKHVGPWVLTKRLPAAVFVNCYTGQKLQNARRIG